MLEDKIYRYFERDPRLHVLFVFDNDIARTFTAELQEITWRDGYRLEVFDECSWFGVKYAIENEWKEDKIILVFHCLPPSNSSSETFPLAGLLAANAAYRSESYEQFMQHFGIPEDFAKIVHDHIEEFDRDKFAKILRPYFNAESFSESVAMRGLLSGYMGESKLLSWEEIILKLIMWDGSQADFTKKNEQFYAALARCNDVQKALQAEVKRIFGFEARLLSVDYKFKEVVESMKYNSITQLLPVVEADTYISLRISDALQIERLNKLLEAARTLPRQQYEAFIKSYDNLSSAVQESTILKTYGVNANYYSVSNAMANEMVRLIAKDMIATDASNALINLAALRSKIDETAPVHNALEYAVTVASFYEKLSRLGTVVLDTPDEYVIRYTEDFYLFDLYYRQSIELYHTIDYELPCYAELETVKQTLDKTYAQIANKINSEWTKCLKERGNGYAEITKALPQQDFFAKVYDPTVKQAIIVCDAFRYELAKELVERLASTTRYTPELTPGLAMLPTETKYCKSALLPHDELDLLDLTLSVDHKILNDTASRAEHLQSKVPGAKIVDFSDVLNGTKESLRQIFTGLRLAVIFFDDVDHEGHGSNPRKVVATCKQGITDLAKAIAKIHDHGNVAHIYLTSDHGFLYNDMVFEEKDKLDVADDSVELKSRYYLTHSQTDVQGVTKFALENVSDMGADLLVAVPDGTNRIKVRPGDYNFAHGGASLQEVIIPVLHTYSPKVNKKVATGVTLLGRNLSIVSSRLKVNLFQDDAVSQSIKERTVRCAIYSGETIVSNEKEVTLGSTNADNPAARTFAVDLTLTGSSSGILQLRVYDVTDNLNPLIKATVTDNTLIERDEF
jgi:hypothetical protein